MPLYLYALLDRQPAAAVTGLWGEALRFVPCGELVAAVGEGPEAPPMQAEALRMHDGVVRRLAGEAQALLPARFGTLIPGEGPLRERVEARAERLRQALELVRGREQMTLRVFGAPRDGGEGGPGTRYLRARALPELGALRRSLAARVVSERVQRHETPPLLASVYHLVERGAAAAYAQLVEAAPPRACSGAIRVYASGPHPPYAFAAEDL